ncbi:hypothetical protein [methanotrophic endosymbiont of Bathymodiolus puteoserpentis (Logatchev)]|jgi:ABC-type multidrug transport system fused ATPase/permease subunit|uniref:hypothetical protein n=1 Tax=methanotrophic endosymbiont of Bathymodiolus puteoserpentis (Logatchev) TaxID=343235 RepID=UPI0013CAB792|nr:hypothetical protein [methanotrophic endosymbiont of Bathymodiolus puteoserpentis (Logatchev)]SHE23233.1 hypothetical protein BPUTEOMOX_2494 [methanotrophic endosymbiont of Bathymodiolus puteoserpentis (Logatchev)]
MAKFLPAIIFIQLLTCGLVLMAITWSYDMQLIIVIVFIAIIISVLAAFWFSSIARNIYIDDQATLLERHAQDREKIRQQAEIEKASIVQEKSQLQDRHAREREQILLDAERDKANTVAASYKKIEQETRKAHARANFKVGLAFAAAAGVGGVLIFSQLITIGAMVIVASGSGLSGYILRARQERLSRKKQLALNETKLLTDQSEKSSLWGRLKKD